MKRAAPRKSLRLEALLVQARWTPIALADALSALGRQATLGLPAKLIVDASAAPGLCVELARTGGSRRPPAAEEGFAAAVLEAAVSWLERPDGQHGLPAGSDAPWSPAPDGADHEGLAVDEETVKVRAAIEGLGWPLTMTAPGSFRVTVPSSRSDGPVLVECTGAGFVRASHTAQWLRVASAEAGSAVALFAMEVNARLRLARVGIEPTGAESLHVTWQAVVPTFDDLGRWLEEGVAAAYVARSETLPALRALTAPGVADRYLALRGLAGGASSRPDEAGRPPQLAATV